MRRICGAITTVFATILGGLPLVGSMIWLLPPPPPPPALGATGKTVGGGGGAYRVMSTGLTTAGWTNVCFALNPRKRTPAMIKTCTTADTALAVGSFWAVRVSRLPKVGAPAIANAGAPTLGTSWGRG